jgi:hypothetical protein
MVDSSMLRMPGVMGVATGYKRVKGKMTKDLSLIVYVAKKLPLDRIPYFHAIPSSLTTHGVDFPTDIVEVGYYIPYSHTKRERPALGGVSIGHLNVTAGTLGGLVCDKEEGDILILSNNHVLADVNKGKQGDHIVQPGVADEGACHEDCIGELERFVSIDFASDAKNHVDCAVARPYDTSDVSFEIHDIGVPNLTETYTLNLDDVASATQVQKTGRTTQHTVGYVSAVDWKGTVLYDWTPGYFENQIVVETLDGNPVGLGGDSGSLVLTMDNKLCGLLFAGPADGTHYLANHIGEVLNSLDVKLCCGASEASKGTDAEEFLPDVRKLRDQVLADAKLRSYVNLYGKHSGKLMEAMLKDPKLGEIVQNLVQAVGKVVRNPRQRVDQTTVGLAVKLMDAVARMRRADKELEQDMRKAKNVLKNSAGKTLGQILNMLKK